jgi:hypothetical protein
VLACEGQISKCFRARSAYAYIAFKCLYISGGAFVLKAQSGGETDDGAFECVWSHHDRFNADQAEIPVLLEAAGLPSTAYRPR